MGELSPDRLVVIVTELLTAKPNLVEISISTDGSSYQVFLNGGHHIDGSLNPPTVLESLKDRLEPIPSDYHCRTIMQDRQFTQYPTSSPMNHLHLIKKVEAKKG